MNKRISLYALLVLIASLAFLPSPASAQTATSTPKTIYSCPVYGQEIVKVKISAPAGKFLAGTEVPLKISLENKANYPLVNGGLLVRVFSDKFSDKSLSSISPVLVERFLALGNINLSIGGSSNNSIKLNLREKLPSGSYTVIASYISNSQFNVENPDNDLDKISGVNAAEFSINVTATGDNKDIVFFDKNSLVVPDAKNGVVNSTINIVNTSSKTLSVPVFWRLYYWNAITNTTLLRTSVSTINVGANGHTQVSYTVDNSEHSLYQVLGVIDSIGMRSIATWSVEGAIGESLVRSLNLSVFPKRTQGTDSTVSIFGCINNTFSNSSNTGTLYLTVAEIAEKTENILHRSILPITPGWQFDFERVFSLKGARDVRVTADVFSTKGKIVQHLETSFRCDSFGDSCKVASSTKISVTSNGTSSPVGPIPYKWILVLSLGIIGVLVVFLILRKFKKRII